MIHGSPRRSRISTPAVPRASVVERPERRRQAVLEVLDEGGRVHWLAQRGVVNIAVEVEVAREIVLGVAPAAGADDPDLAAADRVAQRVQHAQLVRDPLDPPVGVDDRATPRRRDDAVGRDPLAGGVVLKLAWLVGVAREQLERLADRAVGGVVAAEL